MDGLPPAGAGGTGGKPDHPIIDSRSANRRLPPQKMVTSYSMFPAFNSQQGDPLQ
jgi:hypothetical protein